MLIRAKEFISHFNLATVVTEAVTYCDSSPVMGAGFQGVGGLFWTVEQEDREDTIVVKGDTFAFTSNRNALEDADVGTQLSYRSEEVGVYIQKVWEKVDDHSWQLILDNIYGENVPVSDKNIWNLEEQNLLIQEKVKRGERLLKQTEVFKAGDDRFAALKALKR